MRELDRDRIVAEALRLLDEHGLPGFSIRRIARAFGVTPMALYHHVKNKAELAELMVDAAARERPLAKGMSDWRDELWSIALWMRESNLAHPALADLRRTYGVWTPSILTFTERWVTGWQRSGLPAQAALLAAHASSRAVIGLVAAERPLKASDNPAPDLLAQLPNAGLLLTPVENDARLFEISVRAMLDGLFHFFSDRENIHGTGDGLWESTGEAL